MKHAKILGTGSYLPAQRVTNEELARRVDTSDEWITTRTGIKARHIAADNEKTSDLAHAAALRALDDAGIAAGEIDLIIVATATPDMQFPAAATIVQQKLGVSGCPAFDVQAVCAGFVYAMATANAYIKSGMAKKALVIGADTFSRHVDLAGNPRAAAAFSNVPQRSIIAGIDRIISPIARPSRSGRTPTNRRGAQNVTTPSISTGSGVLVRIIREASVAARSVASTSAPRSHPPHRA